MKICSKCKIKKEDSDFSYNTTYKDGLSYHCRSCCRDYFKKYRQQNIDKIKKYRLEKREYYKQLRQNYYQKNKERELSLSRKWYYENKEHQQELKGKYRETLKGRIVFWKRGARRRNLEWKLTDDDVKNLIKPMVCYYTNDQLTLKRNQQNTISLDRIDSKKGYIHGNVVICQQIVNKMKSNLSESDFLNFCRKIVDNKIKL